MKDPQRIYASAYEESIIYRLAIIARANSLTGQHQTQEPRSVHKELSLASKATRLFGFV